MHPANHIHLAHAKRVPSAMPHNEERDLFGGLGGIVTGIINGVNSILHPGHTTANNNNHGVNTRQTNTKPTKQVNAAPPATTHKQQQQVTQKAAAAAPSPAKEQASSSAKSPTSETKDGAESSAAPQPTPTPSSSSSSSSTSASSTVFSPTATSSETPSSSTDTPTVTPNPSNAIASGGGISKAGLGVLITVLILLFLAVALLFYRRRAKKRREAKSAAAAWASTNFPKFEEKPHETPSGAAPSGTPTIMAGVIGAGAPSMRRQSSVMADEQSYITAADVGHHNNSSLSIPPLPNSSFAAFAEPHSPLAASIASRQRSAFSDFGRSPPNSPGAYTANGIPSPLSGMPSELAPLPAVYGSDSDHTNGSSHQSVDAMEALVSCSFIPSLPDELNITTGERVRILEEYDDGWAKCQNARGDEGMVPVECVRRLTTPNAGTQATWRHSQRISSISGH